MGSVDVLVFAALPVEFDAAREVLGGGVDRARRRWGHSLPGRGVQDGARWAARRGACPAYGHGVAADCA